MRLTLATNVRFSCDGRTSERACAGEAAPFEAQGKQAVARCAVLNTQRIRVWVAAAKSRFPHPFSILAFIAATQLVRFSRKYKLWKSRLRHRLFRAGLNCAAPTALGEFLWLGRRAISNRKFQISNRCKTKSARAKSRQDAGVTRDEGATRRWGG